MNTRPPAALVIRCYFISRCSVDREIFSSAAALRQLVPAAKSSCACALRSALLIFMGRPSLTPFSFLSASAALVRSPISSRSNWLIAASMVKVSREVGELSSTPSPRTTTDTPRAIRASMVVITSSVSLPSLSSLATTSASPGAI